MGDRTYHQLYIHDCPPEKAGIVLDILDRHGFGPEYATDIPDTTLILGEKYMIEETLLGTTKECVDDLIAAVPEIVLDGWEDPKYEWMGDGVMYHPDRGRFDYACGQDGVAVFTADQVKEALALPDAERDLFLGIDWLAGEYPDDGHLLPRPEVDPIEWSMVPGVNRTPDYVDGKYKGMHVELFHQADGRWAWSFYDNNSPVPDMAVARGDQTTRAKAEAELVDYIDGYVTEERA